MWPLLISCLCLQLGETLMALVNKKPWSGSSQYPSPCVDHIPKNSHSTSLRARWASGMTAQYSYSIWAALRPCLFPHHRCKRANMLSHPPNTSTLTRVPANSHSDGQPHSAGTLPLLINTFITRWTKHKITLRLGRANRKQTANFSATVSSTALRDLVLQRITFTFQKNKFTIKNALCLCSYHPLFYWLVMSMCNAACSCLSLYTCTYWALQKEILWAEFNGAEIIPTSLPVKTTICSG